MRITKVTPIGGDTEPEAGVEVYAGERDEIEREWYQDDVVSLMGQLDAAGVKYREYHLMRKAVGFESGLLVGLLVWGGKEALKVLTAWLPAREGRKVRVKFKDGSEIEATTVTELEQIRDKFLPKNAGQDPGDV